MEEGGESESMTFGKKETSDDYRILNHNYHNHDNIIVLSHPSTQVVQLPPAKQSPERAIDCPFLVTSWKEFL